MIILLVINIILERFLIFGNGQGLIFQPQFSAPILNLSVAIGREATFKCLVHHLGNYKVGWVKADTKAIQAIDKTVVTHNSRVSVSHEGHGVWKLHIRDVKDDDKGLYMCQINTDPMTSQVGHLEVLIPPDFNSERTSSDVLCTEGSTIRLKCSARGRPEPKVIWRREDGKDIIIRTEAVIKTKWEQWNRSSFVNYEKFVPWDVRASRRETNTPIDAHASRRENEARASRQVGGPTSGADYYYENYEEKEKLITNKLFNAFKVNNFQGELLKLNKISRYEMGAYLCIASNGVPPSISKRIIVHVHFPPKVQVPNQLVGAPLGTHVTLECLIEAYPSAITYWVHNTGEIITSNEKYNTQIVKKSLFETNMILIIKKLVPEDLGSYLCTAKNSLGEMENSIRLYEIPGPTIHPFDSDDEFIGKIGSKIRHFKHINIVSTVPKVSNSDVFSKNNYSTNEFSKAQNVFVINKLLIIVLIFNCVK